MQFDESANSQIVVVKLNETFEIALPEVRTAGYLSDAHGSSLSSSFNLVVAGVSEGEKHDKASGSEEG